MKLLIATTNPGKLAEFKQGLAPLIKQGYQLLSLKEVGITENVEETGTTFRENAIIKAEFFAQKSGLTTVADDGGFVIKALGGEPGVKSRRWLGYRGSDEELINYTLERIKNIPDNELQAHLELCLCYFDPKTNRYYFEEEKIKGYIVRQPTQKIVAGFPYRALLKVEPFNKYYDELTKEEHLRVNHRLKALQKLVKKLKV